VGAEFDAGIVVTGGRGGNGGSDGGGAAMMNKKREYTFSFLCLPLVYRSKVDLVWVARPFLRFRSVCDLWAGKARKSAVAGDTTRDIEKEMVTG